MLFTGVVTSLCLLSACASGHREHPPPPPPLPPPPPYERYAGEAAEVRKVLDDISSNRHTAAPRPVETSTPPSSHPGPVYPRLPGYPALFVVTNSTDCHLGLYVGGAVFRQFGMGPGRAATVELIAGRYLLGVDTHLCAARVPPLFGEASFEAGSVYTLTISGSDLQPKVGKLRIENRTEGPLTLRVDGASHTIGTGTSELELDAGSHSTTASAKCGSKSDAFALQAGAIHTVSYWCVGGTMSTEAPQLGYFDVDNSTGAPLTVKVAGKTHRISSGTTTIELPAGSYEARVEARCGSTNVSLEITSGSRQIRHYSCVTYGR